MVFYIQGFKPRVYVNVRDKSAQKCEIKWTKKSREKTVGLSSYGLFIFKNPKHELLENAKIKSEENKDESSHRNLNET